MGEKTDRNINDSVSSAEFLLSTLCSNADEYTVSYCGESRRTLFGELLNIDTAYNEAVVARDGMMQILPEGLLFGKEEIKDLVEYNKKKEALDEFFTQNFDNPVFHTGLKWEKKLSWLEENLSTLVLKELFDITLGSTANVEVKKLAQQIPVGQYIKGNIKMLSLVSQHILKHDVEVRESGKQIIFTVLVDNLSATEYLEEKKQLSQYFSKLAEWFLPYDCQCSYEVKAHERHMKLGKKLILNYNTRLWKRG